MSKTAKAVAWGASLLVALGILFIALRGCTLMPWNEPAQTGTVKLRVTRDFGRELIEDRLVEYRTGDSVMDVLKSGADVETTYGGGFVESIDGLQSGTVSGKGGEDWFYYVNGILPDRGAGDYEVERGDTVWWDYHGWGGENFTPAVVGAYPAPFTTAAGDRNAACSIYSSGSNDGLAREVGGYLEGEGSTVHYSGDPSNLDRDSIENPCIVFIDFSEADSTGWTRELFERAGSVGVFIRLDNGEPLPLDEEGNPVDPGEGIDAAVLATGTGIGDENPVWIVLSRGETGRKAARTVLVENPGSLSMKAGAAVGESGRVFRLPVEEAE